MIQFGSQTRKAFAVAGVMGAAVLAGCSGEAIGDSEAPAPSASQGAGPAQTPATNTATGTYVDGTYTAEGAYQTPESIEQIEVTLTLQRGSITDVVVTGDPQRPDSVRYQGEFIEHIADEVVGRSIDEIDVHRVAGSSLTSGGFNMAVEKIRQQAAG